MKYKLKIAYDGTLYGGWQIQKNAVTIQSSIEKALQTILRENIAVFGSGRTDAGVHALGQIAHFTTHKELDCDRMKFSLNSLLSSDIRIVTLEPTSDEFHARFSAISKEYHYHLHFDRVINPFTRLYTTHILHQVDLNLMQEAIKHFKGTHDFTSFANEKKQGSVSRDPIRTLHILEMVTTQGGVVLKFQADGFLYRMVRNITGTLLDIASKKIPVDSVPKIFESKDRKQAGKAAPPQGLFLVKVNY